MQSNYLRKMIAGIACLVMLAVGGAAAHAQNGSVRVRGQVLDVLGQPIIGAAVVVQGTTQGTVTDIDGRYELTAGPDDRLEVSFIGYDNAVLPVDGRTEINFELSESFTELEELVVVGYGVQKKSDVTGATARVGEQELKSMPVKNALEALQGRTSGVDITSNQRPGEVGGIQIRGTRSINASNAPLYVVDGMVVQNGGIENINPQDIESIDILKDASATAIYGSRGANGVVLVTTKQGQKGKMQLNYTFNLTVDKMKDVMDMMSASQWLEYSRTAKRNMGSYKSDKSDYDQDKAAFGGVAASWANIEQAYSGGSYDPSKVGSFDWASYGEQTGVTQEHTLSASGGSDTFKGYASFGYMKQKGTQPGQEYERYNLKTSFEVTPVPFFTFGSSVLASYGLQDYGYSFTKSVTGAGDLYGALRAMLPWTVPYDADGNYILNPNGDVNIINPIRELDYNTNKRNTFRISAAINAQVNFGEIWKPLEGLSYRIQFGPEFRYYTVGIANAADGINGDGNNVAQYSNDQRRSWTLDNLIYYNRTFADVHSLNLTLMQSASKYHTESGSMKASNVASAEELWYNLSSSSTLASFGTGLTETQMASYMGRVNYSFMDKYLLTASVRWDGASQLSEGNKWETFPSVALAWRLDQEEFIDLYALSQLKLRLGYGITGNSAISAYATKGALQSSYYNFGQSESTIGYVPSDASAKTPNKMANQDLGWERTTQYNLGVDFGFFGNRINGSIDIYKTKTTDLLMAMSIPSLTGYTSTYANVGETSGHGVDLMLSGSPVRTSDFEWNSTLTWSMDRNEIEKLANGITEDVNNRWFVGKEIGVYYDYVYDGIWKSSEADAAAEYGRKPGQIRVKDLNNDGKIDANDDRTIVGHTRPRWTAGWNNTFSYRGFELSCFIVSRWDFTVPQGAATLDGRYMMRDLDYWVEGTNENALYYSPGSNGEAADTYSSTMNYQDGSFIKMRNISLAYNFPDKLLKKAHMQNLKVYVQAMNPFTIYKDCDWLDTDLQNYDNNSVTAGSPVTLHSFVFGLNVGF